ncbi:hypothetical protein J2Y45_004036 [Dyadobacter sp. BE34]|uniref:AMIN domain-containing protein n=1 Tax=Dyadobacter fermentans TaxID=94254 RepID=A0ABU1R1Q3_9BACT|nr:MULTISPECIES: hypothetical protein [Dyadobacter]MDR6806844.1 hypothetical protein [Dyadobacter fermentans]MDR7044586.1 hypothetical protein [Dyadobacter sp. BE242]MDR7198896.1 hypothetical protein [Dyadobacter sp. BE34]MDR7216858.1 hypothetical protein [Dyadobacter sp. BE31]MDR7263616.1 hypothetical protein [Dyadobacter sp. BE32]
MRNLLLSILLLQSLHFGAFVQAQPAPQGSLRAEADSSRSYWRVLTDAGSRNTRVQFFGKDHALLYQEDVPEKWIRQNKRNQRRLDKLLADISANQLIVARLKTEELPAEPVRTGLAPATEMHEGGVIKTSYQFHVTINSAGKVRLAVNNPESLRYKIEIADYRDKIVYQEFTSHDQYRRYFDISPVIGDTAKVILTIDEKRFVYNIRREQRGSVYSVDPVIAKR